MAKSCMLVEMTQKKKSDREKVIDHIKTLLGFDLTNLVTSKKRRYFIVDWSEVPPLVKVNIERVAYESKTFRLEKNGVSGMAFIFI